MPIKVVKDLAAIDVLAQENIFVMDDFRALSQDIRPLDILIINLMPDKEQTETQILRLLSNTPLQVNVSFLRMASHQARHYSTYLEHYYYTFSQVNERFFDGLIITGAPVEQLPFTEVDYWQELTGIMDWSREHVFSTLYICWAAQAGLYHHFGIPKCPLPQKICGIFMQEITDNKVELLRGVDDVFRIPHSRYTEADPEAIRLHPELQVLVWSEEVGPSVICSGDNKHVFLTGHSEYDAHTLDQEYRRDLAAGIAAAKPRNYYPDDDINRMPPNQWRSPATLLFTNWLNYYVYQETPYDQQRIPLERK